MYILNAYRVEEKAELLAFMHQNSFATLVSIVDGSPFASHLPLTVVDNGEQILLRGHFAKANPHWRAHENGGELLTIFHGAHAYISPSQYETQEAVPTWNYIAVHAYGQVRWVEDPDAVIGLLEKTIMTYETAYLNQWRQLDEDFKSRMVRGIVAFEIEVTELQGKEKLSQNKTEQERRNIAESLEQSPHESERSLAEHMQSSLDREEI